MTYKTLWISLVILNGMDYLCTDIILGAGEQEENPIQAYMITTFGNIGMLYLKIPALAFIGILLAQTPKTQWITNILIVLNVIYISVVVYSLYLIYLFINMGLL